MLHEPVQVAYYTTLVGRRPDGLGHTVTHAQVTRAGSHGHGLGHTVTRSHMGHTVTHAQVPYYTRLYPGSSPGPQDPLTGWQTILLGYAFDVTRWAWKPPASLRLSGTLGAAVVVTTADLGYYSVLTANRGCDRTDLSTVAFDACGLCGGDNSSCSGCDGVPRTGRDKNCSGNGACRGSSCLCNATWFGYSCNVPCRSLPSCTPLVQYPWVIPLMQWSHPSSHPSCRSHPSCNIPCRSLPSCTCPSLSCTFPSCLSADPVLHLPPAPL